MTSNLMLKLASIKNIKYADKAYDRIRDPLIKFINKSSGHKFFYALKKI